MLTGDVEVTQGDAYLDGYSIRRNLKAVSLSAVVIDYSHVHLIRPRFVANVAIGSHHAMKCAWSMCLSIAVLSPPPTILWIFPWAFLWNVFLLFLSLSLSLSPLFFLYFCSSLNSFFLCCCFSFWFHFLSFPSNILRSFWLAPVSWLELTVDCLSFRSNVDWVTVPNSTPSSKKWRDVKRCGCSPIYGASRAAASMPSSTISPTNYSSVIISTNRSSKWGMYTLTNRQTDRQTDRQSDRQTHTNMECWCDCRIGAMFQLLQRWEQTEAEHGSGTDWRSSHHLLRRTDHRNGSCCQTTIVGYYRAGSG